MDYSIVIVIAVLAVCIACNIIIVVSCYKMHRIINRKFNELDQDEKHRPREV